MAGTWSPLSPAPRGTPSLTLTVFRPAAGSGLGAVPSLWNKCQKRHPCHPGLLCVPLALGSRGWTRVGELPPIPPSPPLRPHPSGTGLAALAGFAQGDGHSGTRGAGLRPQTSGTSRGRWQRPGSRLKSTRVHQNPPRGPAPQCRELCPPRGAAEPPKPLSFQEETALHSYVRAERWVLEGKKSPLGALLAACMLRENEGDALGCPHIPPGSSRDKESSSGGGSPFPRGAAPLFQPCTRQGLKEGNQTAAYNSASSMFRVFGVCLIKGILRRQGVPNRFGAVGPAQSGCLGLSGGKPFSTTPIPPCNQPSCFKCPSPRPQHPPDPNFLASSKLCWPGWAGEGTKHKPHRGRDGAGGFGVGEGTARGTLSGGEGHREQGEGSHQGMGWEDPALKCFPMGPLRKPHSGLRAGCPCSCCLRRVFFAGEGPAAERAAVKG